MTNSESHIILFKINDNDMGKVNHFNCVILNTYQLILTVSLANLQLIIFLFHIFLRTGNTSQRR